MKLVVVTGISGAGKSSALSVLEDAGYYCVDNLPSGLLRQFLRYHQDKLVEHNIAVGIDSRASEAELKLLPAELEVIRADGVDAQVLYLDADQASLLKRYSQTRRRHPLTNEQVHLADALVRERVVLTTLYELADQVVDTSHISMADLRLTIHELVLDSGGQSVSLLLQSFGFKHGAPVDADFVFDVRCLPNPYYVESLRPLTGLDVEVQAFFAEQSDVANLICDLTQYLDRWLPGCAKSKRSYISVAIGCTGGQHRSVFVTEQLKQRLAECFPRLQVIHRDAGSHK